MASVVSEPRRTSIGLETPLCLPCGAVLPNRIAKVAMSEQLGTRRGQPTRALVRLYQRWAAGAAGLLITGNVMVDRATVTEPYNVVVDDLVDTHMLSAWAAAGRSRGGEMWLELGHPGRQALRTTTRKSVAPSAIKTQYGMFLAPPRALDHAEIVALIDAFARAAELAEQCGFSGAHVHAAHGYLFNQFLSPLSNVRSDEWGGSPDNRMRFLLETIRAIRSRVSNAFAVGVKLNSADFQQGGFSEDESVAVIAALNDEGVDLIEVTGGTFESPVMQDGVVAKDSTLAREAYFLEYARKMREVALMPLMLSGGIRTPATMRQILAERSVDVVGLARPFAVCPDLPRMLFAGEEPAFSAPRRTLGSRTVDQTMDSRWYGQQIRRLSQNKDPDPRRGLLRTASSDAMTTLRWRLHVRRASGGGS
jgi:2,4-dienoyl-CoA reductase-like NADH-dependent reductase (Old Yellow Enzyme family)